MPKHRVNQRQLKNAKASKKNVPETSKKNDEPKINEDSFFYKLMHIDQFFSIPTRAVVFSLTDYLLLLFTVIISLITHLLKIGEPASVIFDEVYFGNFTNYYHYGEYYFDIHPPLGKLILYGCSLISGYKAQEVYSHIGAPLNYQEIRKLRIW